MLIPGIVYVWFKNEKYIVYDGIHRLLAAFSCNFNMVCLVHIKITENEQDIIDDFKNINKSVSVPSIFLEETSVFKQLVCQNVASELCKLYPAFVSPSRKPFMHNFNRDNVVEFISTLEIDFTKSGIEYHIIDQLCILNRYASEYVVYNQINVPKKCHSHKFYLWYLNKPFIKKKIEESLRP
jgi:hypothetical protein